MQKEPKTLKLRPYGEASDPQCICTWVPPVAGTSWASGGATTSKKEVYLLGFSSCHVPNTQMLWTCPQQSLRTRASGAEVVPLTTSVHHPTPLPSALNSLPPLSLPHRLSLSLNCFTQYTGCHLHPSLTPSQEPWAMNHFSLSRLYFLALKRAPILLIILRMKKVASFFFWLRRWLNFSIYSCKRDISSHGFYPSSVYAHFK